MRRRPSRTIPTGARPSYSALTTEWSKVPAPVLSPWTGNSCWARSSPKTFSHVSQVPRWATMWWILSWEKDSSWRCRFFTATTCTPFSGALMMKRWYGNGSACPSTVPTDISSSRPTTGRPSCPTNDRPTATISSFPTRRFRAASEESAKDSRRLRQRRFTRNVRTGVFSCLARTFPNRTARFWASCLGKRWRATFHASIS